jgi:hypothetical protein
VTNDTGGSSRPGDSQSWLGARRADDSFLHARATRIRSEAYRFVIPGTTSAIVCGAIGIEQLKNLTA